MLDININSLAKIGQYDDAAKKTRRNLKINKQRLVTRMMAQGKLVEWMNAT